MKQLVGGNKWSAETVKEEKKAKKSKFMLNSSEEEEEALYDDEWPGKGLFSLPFSV